MSLAIQLVAASASPVGALVFDEIDSGIGGGVAETIGKALRQLGKQRQVLCVTHLPQVAASGNDQWSVLRSGRGKGQSHSSIWTAARASPSWPACSAARRAPRASTPRSCWTKADENQGQTTFSLVSDDRRKTWSALISTGRWGQFFLVQSAYRASECPCSSKPRWRATSVWRFSMSGS